MKKGEQIYSVNLGKSYEIKAKTKEGAIIQAFEKLAEDIDLTGNFHDTLDGEAELI